MAEMQHSESWNAGEEEGAEELADWEEISYKDQILFCIDGGDSMYEMNPNTGLSYLHQALEGAFKVINKKLISSPSDFMGVMIFGTGNTQNSPSHSGQWSSGCYMYLDVKQVGVVARQKLKQTLIESEHDPLFLQNLFGKRKHWSKGLPSVIDNCKMIFRKTGKAGTKRVFWITNEDDPVPGSRSAEAHRKCLESIRAAKKVGIEFDPFLISKPEAPRFRIGKFYSELFQMYDDEILDQNIDTADEREQRTRLQWDWEVGAEEFDSELLTRETPKRTTFSVKWEIGDEWFIGVKGYSTIQPAKKDPPVWFYRDEYGMAVQAVSKPFYEDADTGKRLAPDERIKAFTFGNAPIQGSIPAGTPNIAGAGDDDDDDVQIVAAPRPSKVELTEEEMRSAKTLHMEPGMKLIGFMDQRWLQPEDNIVHANFLRPTDQELVGSTCAFASILKYMLVKEKLALALLLPRKGVSPYFVALLPQDEETDEHGVQTVAPGMHIIRLPFADDIRDDPINGTLLDADEERAKAFGDIAERLTSKKPYHPDRYPNPSLALHYTILQREAYQETEEEIPSPRDFTIPNREGIVKAAGILIKAFKHIVRSNPQSSIDITSRGGLAPGEIDPEDVKQKWIDGTLAELKADDLANVCSMLGIAKSGRKAEKVIRIHNELLKAMPEVATQHNLTEKIV